MAAKDTRLALRDYMELRRESVALTLDLSRKEVEGSCTLDFELIVPTDIWKNQQSDFQLRLNAKQLEVTEVLLNSTPIAWTYPSPAAQAQLNDRMLHSIRDFNSLNATLRVRPESSTPRSRMSWKLKAHWSSLFPMNFAVGIRRRQRDFLFNSRFVTSCPTLCVDCALKAISTMPCPVSSVMLMPKTSFLSLTTL